jgi:hypothetical protein
MALAIADTADSEGSHLPGIIIIDLSYGNIELIPYAACNGLKDLSLGLERHIFGNANDDSTYAYVHATIVLRIK